MSETLRSFTPPNYRREHLALTCTELLPPVGEVSMLGMPAGLSCIHVLQGM